MSKEALFLAKEKSGLRRRMLALRRALSSDESPYLIKSLFENLVSLSEYQNARLIMAYLAMPDEANLDLFIRYSLERGKIVCVPVCLDEENMEAGRLVSMSCFEKGPFGLRNIPSGYEIISPKEIDMVLLPAVAYDLDGNRLGMGKGYYDRFLEMIPFKKRIGVAWNFQIVPKVPTDVHDKKVCKIVTEERIITVKGMMS